MIISASRRTDIPAFYSEWFWERVKEGFLYVINPMNRKQVSEIRLNPDTVDCFVFWSKNPEPMLDKLSILDEAGYSYYFQFTLTAYGRDVEPEFEHKNEIIRTFRRLSKRIGKERVIWRYDPIFLSGIYTKDFHYQWFEKLCECLADYTDLCVISFLDLYEKTKRNTDKLHLEKMNKEDIFEIAERIGEIACVHHLPVETCSEEFDLQPFGIQKGKCIDDGRIRKITRRELKVKKDDTQREICGCVKSVDIGQYNTCEHYCAYCYANFSSAQVKENICSHKKDSPLLVGTLRGDEKITIREMKSVFCEKYEQLDLGI